MISARFVIILLITTSPSRISAEFPELEIEPEESSTEGSGIEVENGETQTEVPDLGIKNEASPVDIALGRLSTQIVTIVTWKTTTAVTTVKRTCAIYISATGICPKSSFPLLSELTEDDKNEFQHITPSKPVNVQRTTAPGDLSEEEGEGVEPIVTEETQGLLTTSLEERYEWLDDTREVNLGNRGEFVRDDSLAARATSSTARVTTYATFTVTNYRTVYSGSKIFLVGRCTPVNFPYMAC